MKRHGFTLIEIIVVIVLISLLSIIGVTAYSRVQMNARDSKRMGDLNELRSALLLYKSLHGRFPDSFDTDCAGWDASSADSDSDGNFFIDQLANTTILESVPRDPLVAQATGPCQGHDGEGFDYYYYRYTSATLNPAWGCPNRTFIILGADMETVTGTHHPDSPGWDQCSVRTWYENFDYVIGLYE